MTESCDMAGIYACRKMAKPALMLILASIAKAQAPNKREKTAFSRPSLRCCHSPADMPRKVVVRFVAPLVAVSVHAPVTPLAPGAPEPKAAAVIE